MDLTTDITVTAKSGVIFVKGISQTMDTIREEFDIKREKIHSLVGVFYQSTYKTFYVNTVDSATFIKPVGVFVSLGITTSKKTLNDIRTIIENHGYKAVIAEISSVQDKNSGKFLNKLVNTQNPEQYHIENYDKNTVMDEKQSKAELDRLKSLLTVDQDLNVLK